MQTSLFKLLGLVPYFDCFTSSIMCGLTLSIFEANFLCLPLKSHLFYLISVRFVISTSNQPLTLHFYWSSAFLSTIPHFLNIFTFSVEKLSLNVWEAIISTVLNLSLKNALYQTAHPYNFVLATGKAFLLYFLNFFLNPASPVSLWWIAHQIILVDLKTMNTEDTEYVFFSLVNSLWPLIRTLKATWAIKACTMQLKLISITTLIQWFSNRNPRLFW